jgi:hypothetical protein
MFARGVHRATAPSRKGVAVDLNHIDLRVRFGDALFDYPRALIGQHGQDAPGNFIAIKIAARDPLRLGIP